MPVEIGPDGSPIITSHEFILFGDGPKVTGSFVVPESESVGSVDAMMTDEQIPTSDEMKSDDSVKSDEELVNKAIETTAGALAQARIKALRDQALRENPLQGEAKIVVPQISEKKQALLKEIADIVKEHDGLESNVPFNHKYWGMCNEARGMK